MNAVRKEEATALLPVESINAVEVFHDRARLDDLLSRIRDETATLVPDVETDAGRKLIASTAYKVARSKTAIDDAGKALVDDWKRKAKVVDAERKHARDTLDALRDEVRAPLNEWEAEQKRIEEEAIEAARVRREQEEAERLAEIERREAAIREAEEKIEAAKRAEQERIAAEAAAKAQAEREEAIRKEAAERAKQEAAEAQARAEREAAEAVARAEQQAKEAAESAKAAAEKADRDRAEAVRQAEERAQQEAERKERERLAEAARIQAEEDRRAADREHRKSINNTALAALVEHGVDSDTAKRVITLIASDSVPNVSIRY